MQVKTKYKQTEIGLIPEEWGVKTHADLTVLLTNGFVGKATDYYVSSDDGVLYIQGYNVEPNSFNFHGIKKISKEFHRQHPRSCLQPGDLLTIQTGDIGVTAEVPPELAGSNCHALVISRLEKQMAYPSYYCHYFNSARGRAMFKEIETGTTMKHLNIGDMAGLALPVPPLPEQHAIATALSDVDALINSLDRLIAKKREIKQATMQHLLTGKTRLPGFNKKWEVKRFGDIFQLLPTANNPRSELSDGGDIGYIHYGDIHTSNDVIFDCSVRQLPLISEHKVTNLPFILPGDVVMADASEDYDGIGKWVEISQVGSNRVVAGLHTMLLRQRVPVFSSGFMAYMQFMPSIREQLVRLATGVSVYGITKSSIKSIEVHLPAVEEQAAIAAILLAIESEISYLEQRRSKTILVKQGMMQELLTGRTRLV